MTTPHSRLIPVALAMFMAGALVFIRLIAAKFSPLLDTLHHPVSLLITLLLIAGTAWFGFVICLRKNIGNLSSAPSWIFPALLIGGFLLRLCFFDSQAIYENDYKRYLWDGAVTATGGNPYQYSPNEIWEASQPGAASVPELAKLAVMSNEAGGLTNQINSGHLTTIYPPVAQAVFTAAYYIAPFDPNGLRGVFLALEVLGLIALILALKRFNKPLIWASAYWLNPIIILTSYNAIHMDVLLLLPLCLVLLWIKNRPFLSAIALSFAAAIKIWPLLLAPILFRDWFENRLKYFAIAYVVAILTGLSMLPMLLSLHDQAGLAAYSATWTNSSFLFPVLRDGLGFFIDDPDRLTRFGIAFILLNLSLILGFSKSLKTENIPFDLMAIAAAFVLLSPTGYPWYFIWFYVFLPFVIKSWMTPALALLTVGASAYYIRFFLGEAGKYDIYTKILLPLEFGIPLLLLAWGAWKVKRNV